MESITVAVRFRPLSNAEFVQQEEIIRSNQEKFKANFSSEFWKIFQEENTILNTKTRQSFTYDKVFSEYSSNEEVFESIAKPFVLNALNGINTTIFAYGQTSSGKTYTIRGNPENPGIIPLSIREIFSAIQNQPEREFLLRVSYLEVYNEQVNDLLDPTKANLDIRERLDKGVYVDKLTEYTISNEFQALNLLTTGEANRKIGETSMNSQSSRSHTVFRIYIESSCSSDESKILSSQLNLVDLAGSEGVQQTKAENLRLREGSNINKSLLSLSTVIQKLSEGAAKGINPFVNYRDSKMTRLLQPALSGNSKTSIICNVTPAIAYFQESINTLQFGAKAKRIKTNAKVNEVVSSESQLKNMQDEMKKLQCRIEELQDSLNDKNHELTRLKIENNEKDTYHSAILEKVENDNENLKKALIQKEDQLREIQNRIVHSERPSPASFNTPASNEERRSRIQSSLFMSRKTKNQTIEDKEYIATLETMLIERDENIASLRKDIEKIKNDYEEKYQIIIMEGELLNEQIQNHVENTIDVQQYIDSINSLENEKEMLMFQIEEMKILKNKEIEEKVAENNRLRENIGFLNAKIDEFIRRDDVLMLSKLERDYQELLQILNMKEVEKTERQTQIEILNERNKVLLDKFEEQARIVREQEIQISELEKQIEGTFGMEAKVKEYEEVCLAAVSSYENLEKVNKNLTEEHAKDLEKLESELKFLYEYIESKDKPLNETVRTLESQLKFEADKNEILCGEINEYQGIIFEEKKNNEENCKKLEKMLEEMKIMKEKSDEDREKLKNYENIENAIREYKGIIEGFEKEKEELNKKVLESQNNLNEQLNFIGEITSLLESTQLENDALLSKNSELSSISTNFQSKIAELSTLLSLSQAESQSLMKKSSDLEISYNSSLSKLEEFSVLIKSLQSDSQSLIDQKSELEALYNASQSKLDELSNYLQENTNEKEKLEHEMNEFKARMADYEALYTTAQSRLDELSDFLQENSNEKDSLDTELSSLKTKNEELIQKLEYCETELNEVKLAYEQTNEENSNLVSKIEELEKNNINKDHDKLQATLDKYLQENSSLNQALIQKDIEYSKLKEEFYQNQQAAINRSNEKNKERIFELKDQVEQWKEKVQEHEKALKDIKDDKKKLQDTLEQLEKENSDLSNLLSKKEKIISKSEEEITNLKRRNSYKRLQSDLIDENMVKSIFESERHDLHKKIQDAEFKQKCSEEDLTKFKKSYESIKIDNEMLLQGSRNLTKQKRELEKSLRLLEDENSDLKSELQKFKKLQEMSPIDIMPRKRGEKKKGFLPSELKNSRKDRKELKQRDSDYSQNCETQ
ncbi:unnamed protein product [Blepharisma stoltei]|uniref:Kinesin motor domain-containing protein n=1 Tax=Blepharisma stoltei TaxID=1481888 RepID=A0AAU9J3M0_9CILI|nr:unnamed protein product [Blepharisma stoltei]